jgi:hypothetical protein
LSNILRLFLVISYNEGKPLLLYPTMEENLVGCIPQWRKTSSIVPHNARNAVSHISKKPKNINNYININFYAKCFLVMNQDSRWSSLMKNTGGKDFVLLSL